MGLQRSRRTSSGKSGVIFQADERSATRGMLGVDPANLPLVARLAPNTPPGLFKDAGAAGSLQHIMQPPQGRSGIPRGRARPLW
jgi:hypothetical protein